MGEKVTLGGKEIYIPWKAKGKHRTVGPNDGIIKKKKKNECQDIDNRMHSVRVYWFTNLTDI